MAKGYWVVLVEVKNMDGYRSEYVASLGDIFRKFGARYLTRGGETSVVEGSAKSRTVVIEFPSYQAAVDCYKSPEYTKAKAGRRAHAEADFVITEGYDGPQP